MNDIWVLDASPIISLGKADLLRTISSLAITWIIPESVVQEVEAKRPIDSYVSESFLACSCDARRSIKHPSLDLILGFGKR